MLVNGKWEGPIVDQHMHLDKGNRFLSAAEEFSRSGGTGIFLVHKPAFSESLPRNIADYREAYQETVDMASLVREKIGLDVQVVLGPHPVTWEIQANTLGVDESTELHLSAVGLALDMIEEGDAICLGEVGRPHYEVSEDMWERANDMLIEIMRMASSSNSPVQLHVEDNGHHTCRDLAHICDKAGFPRRRAVRHFAPSDISHKNTSGLPVTISMGKGSIEGICSTLGSSESHWGMETDFLDDPKRPGAVLGPKTIPKRTNQLCQALKSLDWEDEKIEQLLLNVHEGWISSTYF
jgi:TatD-related deoxyribonuclease